MSATAVAEATEEKHKNSKLYKFSENKNMPWYSCFHRLLGILQFTIIGVFDKEKSWLLTSFSYLISPLFFFLERVGRGGPGLSGELASLGFPRAFGFPLSNNRNKREQTGTNRNKLVQIHSIYVIFVHCFVAWSPGTSIYLLVSFVRCFLLSAGTVGHKTIKGNQTSCHE